MRERKAIGIFLLFSAFIVLTTCQLQFNKSTGNNVALKVVVPGGVSGGGKSAPGSKSLTNGTSLTVTINQEGTTFSTQQTVSIDGKTSIDFSFSLSSSGVYDVLAVMQDASGSTLAQMTTKLTVPTGNYPVVLTMMSPNLLNAVVADSTSAIYPFSPPFGPTTYSGCVAFLSSNSVLPYTLTLTTLDPQATITSMTENGIPDPHNGSAYTLALPNNVNPVTIVVTAQDGITTQTYTMAIDASWQG
jgi:hypothetical protein